MRSLFTLLLLSACAPTADAPFEDAADSAAPFAGADAPATLPTDAAPPPFTVTANNPILGGKVTVAFQGANAGETVYILRGANGTANPGQCFAQAGGRCSNLVAPAALQATIVASANGDGLREVNFPNTAAWNGRDICFQAAIIRGVGGASSVFSNTSCQEAGYDGDDDGNIDALDICQGFDDWFDWDMDGTPDGCDAVADQPPLFTNADKIVNWSKGNYQGRSAQWFIPANPVGMVLFLHGSGGDAAVAESPEGIIILNELISRGYGFFALTSDNRNTRQWDIDSRPSSNPDWARIRDWRNDKVAAGSFTAQTPFYAWGFSNGGGFAGWLSNAAPANNFPLRAITVQSSTGNSPQYGQPGDMPVQFISARWDDTVPAADVQGRYDDHINAGHIGEYRLIPEQRLAPSRFDRSDNINANRSLELFKVVVDGGWFNKAGQRLFPGPDIDGTIDVIAADPAFTPSPPGKAMLSATLATHAINGYYTVQIANFFDRY